MNDDGSNEHGAERPADWTTDAAGVPVIGPDLLGFDPDDERDDDVAAADAAFVAALFGTALRDEPEGGRSPLAIMAAARVTESDGGEVRRIVERERRSARIRRWVGGTVAAAAVVTFAAVVVPNLGTNTGESAGSDNATVAAASAVGTAEDSGPAAEEMALSSSDDAAGGGQAPAASVPATSAAASSAAESSEAAESSSPAGLPVPAIPPSALPTAQQQTLTTSAAAGSAAEADGAACVLPALPDPALAAARSALDLPADTVVEQVTGACDAGVVGAAVFPAAGVQVVVAAPGSTCAAGLCPNPPSGGPWAERDQVQARSEGQRFVVVVTALPLGAGPDGGSRDPQLSYPTALQQVADAVQAALN